MRVKHLKEKDLKLMDRLAQGIYATPSDKKDYDVDKLTQNAIKRMKRGSLNKLYARKSK
jgi:predicted unusual protein kinase regulating ubiquinone biosynthesis (AarF/ABC1/UbiB family)